jgi:hypothetical protein
MPLQEIITATMLKIASGAGGYAYTYDADGNRVEKSNGSTGTIYWYISPGIVAESDLPGTLKSEYVNAYGPGTCRINQADSAALDT